MLTFEPGDTAVGRKLRQIVLDPATGELSDRTEALLYAADKAEHVDTVVLPALDAGRGGRSPTATSTRRWPTRAPAARSTSPRWSAVARWATGDLRPHLTVVLDLDAARPGWAASTSATGSRGSRWSSTQRVRAGVPRRSPPPTPTTTSCWTPARPVDEIAAAVRERVAPLLGQAARPHDASGTTWSASAAPSRRCATAAGGHGMSHAWLFTGPPGLRAAPTPRSRSPPRCSASERAGCGDCHACHTVLAGLARRRHRDPHREALDRRRRGARPGAPAPRWRPVGRRWQVMIVEDADRLTDQACNALLKAIEEPTARTVWLLCAPTVEDVLPTIRSRCRLVTLTTPTDRARSPTSWSAPRASPTALASYAARASQGHIGRARALARDEAHPQPAPRGGLACRPGSTTLGACMNAATNLARA